MAIRRGFSRSIRAPTSWISWSSSGETSPSVTAGSPGIRAAETLECERQEAGGEPGPVVADLDVEVAALRPGGEHHDRTAGGEPQRVVDEVVDRLPYPVRVQVGVRPGLGVDAAGNAGFGQAGSGEPGAD